MEDSKVPHNDIAWKRCRCISSCRRWCLFFWSDFRPCTLPRPRSSRHLSSCLSIRGRSRKLFLSSLSHPCCFGRTSNSALSTLYWRAHRPSRILIIAESVKLLLRLLSRLITLQLLVQPDQKRWALSDLLNPNIILLPRNIFILSRSIKTYLRVHRCPYSSPKSPKSPLESL
jgi:hypothetical protein